MSEPWDEFWLFFVVLVGIATLFQLSDTWKKETTSNERYAFWLMIVLLVFAEYRLTDVKLAFLQSAPSAYESWKNDQ